MRKTLIQSIEPRKQILIGSILSYSLLILDLLVALFLPRWINSVVGQDNYGVYTLTNSLVAMFLIDFGLGTAASRFLSKLVINGEKEKEKELLGIIFKLYFVIDIVLAIIFVVIYFLIEKIYKGLTFEQLKTLKIIFPIVAVYNLINFPFLSLEGSFISHEQFIAYKGLNLLQKILYTALVCVFLYLKLSVIFISLAAVLSGFIILCSKLIFCCLYCNFKPNFKYWDKETAKKVFSFSIWITIGIIATKLISSLMPSVLGIVSDANNIAVYGYAYALECNAFSFTIVVSSMMLPNVTRLLKDQTTSKKEVDELAANVGKLQMFIISLFFVGFITFGKEFLILLMGSAYSNAYYCFLLLFAPNLISGSLAVCESVSQVTNYVKHLGIIKIISAICVICFAFLFGKRYGAIGVSISYCFFEILCFVLITIIVYKKKQKMNLKYIMKKVFAPSFFPSFFPVVLFFGAKKYISFYKPLNFVIGVVLFSLFYLCLYFCFSLSPEENTKIKSYINQKKNNNSGEIVIDGKIIKLPNEKITILNVNVSYEDYFNIILKKFGSSSTNVDNYDFIFDAKKINNDTTKKVLVCNNEVYSLLENVSRYDRIIVFSGK